MNLRMFAGARTRAAGVVIALTASAMIAGPAMAYTQASLNPNQLGLHLSDKKVNDSQCPMKPGYDAWHFVAPANDAFYSLTIGFSGTSTAITDILDAGKHAYVYTPHVDGADPSVTSGEALVIGTGTQFTLSHTCLGTGTPPPPPHVTDTTTTTTMASYSKANPTFGDGGSITDVATVTNTSDTHTPAGTVTFTYCYHATVAPTSCTSGLPLSSATVSGSGNTATASSAALTPNAAGYYLLHAVFAPSGDMHGSSDDGTNELVYVAAPGVTPPPTVTYIATTTKTVAQHSKATPTVGDGGTISDIATVTAASGTAAPTGTVTFSYCYNATAAPTSCTTGGTAIGSAVTLTAGSTAGTATATSATFTPSAAGYYLLHAVYNATGLFSDSVDNGTDELVRVIDPTPEPTPTPTPTPTPKPKAPTKWGDVPSMIDTGKFAAAAKCPTARVGGNPVGSITVDDVTVPVKKVNYPAGGELVPPASAKIAAVSARHRALGATTGTSLIVWHVRYNKGCDGLLNGLLDKQVGDTFSVTDAQGNTTEYELSAIHVVKKGAYKRDWFRLNGPRQLTIVTCSNLVNGKFVKNTVLIAVPVTA